MAVTNDTTEKYNNVSLCIGNVSYDNTSCNNLKIHIFREHNLIEICKITSLIYRSGYQSNECAETKTLKLTLTMS